MIGHTRAPWTLILLSAGLAACGPDPETVAAKEAAEAKVRELEGIRSRLEKENQAQAGQLRQMEADLSSARREVALARLGLGPGEAIGAVIDTSLGTIRCALWPEKAPLTVTNFVQLAEGTREWTDPRTGEKKKVPLYDGTIFHRVIPKFMIQGGDPMGDGRGGPGYTFADETENGLSFDRPGLLAMANSGPDTNGSQFFITDRDTPTHLNGKHTIFGACQDAAVVETIATTPAARGNRPVTDVVMRKVSIVRGAAAQGLGG
jgi:peptidyl-prolyl cis-trans isomerase A (cyclophilin A)